MTQKHYQGKKYLQVFFLLNLKVKFEEKTITSDDLRSGCTLEVTPKIIEKNPYNSARTSQFNLKELAETVKISKERLSNILHNILLMMKLRKMGAPC